MEEKHVVDVEQEQNREEENMRSLVNKVDKLGVLTQQKNPVNVSDMRLQEQLLLLLLLFTRLSNWRRLREETSLTEAAGTASLVNMDYMVF